ncbi:hypothetical protein HII31_07806 [Pseudocercospora fuligena]|uniref:Chromosome segregation ATPase family protein n=1 Tax=Pseudocercospora fuligena TaxID=685502 RepID=A0A8H6VHH1_9PEZI|nr:hypothetical protein HII31_07806 [Pseudocercospora fuligena]
MSSYDRESSRDREARHQHSWSETNGRASVPMWDSSDPARAPPPLPLNPSVDTPTTKANTSAGIAAAAKQIVEKARESAPISSYTSNRNSDALPERSLVKGAHHKRMQSLQTSPVKDLRSYLENRSPERSPERPTSRTSYMPGYSRMNSIEDMSPTPNRSNTSTPLEREPSKETPTQRPTTRPPPRSILGENTPPSATMLALQTMQVPDPPPFADITNGPSTPGGTRVHTNYDFSSQLLNLTTIATNLQKEMAQLSRRSKDNATDLLTLKEATNSRDEDIRKSLKELSQSVSGPAGLLGPPPFGGARTDRSMSHSQFLDNKAFGSPPSVGKNFGLPRAASAHSFLEMDRCDSPSPYSVEGVASVAMLEKIIREMVTKEGQDRLLGTLSELLEKSGKENKEAAKKVEELSAFIREKSESQALVPIGSAPPKLELNFDSSKAKSGARRGSNDDEVMKMLQRLKDSVTHSGGTTSETKGLVRDLRGEVLGMGRELGKKLDQISETQLTGTLDRSINDSKDSEHLEQVQQIVEEGLAELKQSLSSMLKERAEQDDDTFKQLAVARSAPNNDDMLAVVQHALHEHHKSVEKPEEENVSLDRDAVLDAVKDGLKDFEPNIELQQFGLERDEILAVLKEGLEEYRSNQPEPAPAQIDKGDVYEVMQEALKNFEAPYPAEQLEHLREDILGNVRQALEDFRPPPAEATNHEAMQAAVFEAVKSGMENHGPAAPREIEISREDLFDAVKASLDGTTIPFGGFGEQVLGQLKELIENMRTEFKQYSAANGRDTEQVLDALKDGLESLRSEIETYVDRAQDVTGKDEIVDTVKLGLEQLREDVRGFCAEGPSVDSGRAEMLEYIKAEFEHLHEAVQNTGSVRDVEDSNAGQTTAVVIALKEGFDDLKAHLEARNEDITSNDELNEAMKEEFDQLKAAILNAHASDKSELVESIQDSMGALHAKFNGTELSTSTMSSTEEVILTVREELATLKESIHAMISDIDKDGIALSVRQTVDDLRTQMLSDQSDASAEALAAIRQELEALKDALGSAVVPAAGSERSGSERSLGEDSEDLESVRAGLDEIKETLAKHETQGISVEQLEAIRGEFENLRNSIASSVVHSGDKEEILDAVRLGLDDLRSHLERKLDNPETVMQHHTQVLDALNEGLESLRGDIVKTLDKPLDQTVNYEILDTLKDGLAGLRSEMDKLTSRDGRPVSPQGGEIVLADGTAVGQTRDIGAEDASPVAGAANASGIAREDFEKVEVLLAQLQIKIAAMDQTIQDIPAHQAPTMPEGITVKDDLAALESMIRELQESVVGLAASKSDEPAPESAARKEDTDAIETLLRNTKAQIEELVLPDPEKTASKEHLEEVQTAVRMANDALDSLVDKLDTSVATKADVAVVEVLATDAKALLEELKEKHSSDEAKPDVVTKADLDVLGVICTEIKTTVNEMTLPNVETMPTKSDIEQLQGLISDFRESHDKMRDSYETDIAVTAKAFDDRKKEFDDTVAQIEEVKNLLTEVKVELMDKVSDGETGINALGETMKGIEERSNNEDVIAEVKDVMEKLKEEFERAHTSIEAIKVDHAASAESSLEKQSEHKTGIITELGEKLDGLFDGMMSKYDDAQTAAEEKAKTMEENATQQQELLESTKSMADDLKLSIDTLGATMTAFMGDLPAQVEKMTEESKTVFAQVESTHNKLEETSEALKGEHSATRDEVSRVLAAVDVVQTDMSEHNPRVILALEEVRAIINQHYEHSQQASTAQEEQAQAVKELHDALKAGFEESKTHHADSFKTHQEEMQRAIPGLLPAPVEAAAPVEKYDDAAVHEKLDKLMGHVQEASERSTQLERLDQIHEKVMATAAEISAFVITQNKQIEDVHESKEKEAEEIALLLERRLERKDQLEADITVLNEEKETLHAMVEQLKAEKEALAAQKARLNADVSSMETALHIRREELHDMDVKAAAIERRMLEGVMNQSRMLLLAKTPKATSPQKKKPQGRDLRVPSNASAVSAQTVTSTVPPLQANHALAMKTRPGLARNGPMPNTAERRIMSLNQINQNVPNGASAFTSAKPLSALNNVKRSHSVKHNFARKPSWSHQKRVASLAENKENETLSEEDESEHQTETPSEAGTTRRQSYLSGTDSYANGSYLDGESADVTPMSEDGHRQSGYAASDATFETGSYLTGSYLTGSDIDQRTSLGGSSAAADLGAEREDEDTLSILPRSELSTVAEQTEPASSVGRMNSVRTIDTTGTLESDVSSVAPLQATSSEIEAAVQEVMKEEMERIYAPPSDSGLGTDCPTAIGSNGGGGAEEYFGK